MTPREIYEKREADTLSEFATLAAYSKGRAVNEEPCQLRTCFSRDRDRIIHSKSFRRLKHKTQVFLSPERDHYRTRLTHTLEVAQIARTIARSLFLNEDLTEAIALGHDLGHTPFGHAGERKLGEICGFIHSDQSLRVVDVLEKDHKGLNLTWEVRDGIFTHTGNDGRLAATLEGQIVKLADRIAYMNHDIDDAIRGNILTENDIPVNIKNVLGHSHSKRIDTLIKSVIEASSGENTIKMTDEISAASDALHNFMYESVYINPKAKSEESKAETMVQMLFEYYVKNKDKLPADYLKYVEEDGVTRTVCDFVAGMSDRYAIATFENIYVPKTWNL